MVGSGPYRFLADEYISGSRVVYARFEGYVPRQEPPDWTAGRQAAAFRADGMEHHAGPRDRRRRAADRRGRLVGAGARRPDPGAAPQPRHHRRGRQPAGLISHLRASTTCSRPSTTRASAAPCCTRCNQEDYMRRRHRRRPGAWRDCHAMFPCGTPLRRRGRQSRPCRPAQTWTARAAMLKEAGYKGEKVGDHQPDRLPAIGPLGQVTADLLRRLGMNVDLQEMDWGTRGAAPRQPGAGGEGRLEHLPHLLAGRLHHEPGGQLRRSAAQGDRGWFGWYSNPRMEELTAAWLVARARRSRSASPRRSSRRAGSRCPSCRSGSSSSAPRIAA